MEEDNEGDPAHQAPPCPSVTPSSPRVGRTRVLRNLAGLHVRRCAMRRTTD